MDATPEAPRFSSQLLMGTKPKAPLAVVEHLLAVQAQDPRGMRLALRPRSRNTCSADVDASLNAGALVVGWLCRGTLHLVEADDYWWLHALTTPQLTTGNSRRLSEEGVSTTAADRGVQIVAKRLSNGACTRKELREALDAGGVPTHGQALVHILSRASIAGLCVRGPMVGNEQAFVDPREWIGPQPSVDLDTAFGMLAHRYLQGHRPGDERDLAKWAGITLTAARAAIKATNISVEPQNLRSNARGAARTPAPLLLGAFDPLLHGWASREWVVGQHEGIVTTNGMFRSFILVQGKAVGLWSLTRGEVELSPFAELPSDVDRRLAAEIKDVQRYLGMDS